jgi:Fe-S oxidoreductase
VSGLPVREHILVEVRDPVTADWLKISNLTERPAEPAAISKREGTIAKMIERNERTRERITHGLPDVLPSNIEGLIEQFDTCGTCQECLDQCPICEVAHPRPDLEGTYLKEDIARWMRSCAGCGMCEQACPNHLPLSAIFHHIKAQLQEASGYTPGMPSPKPLAIR